MLYIKYNKYNLFIHIFFLLSFFIFLLFLKIINTTITPASLQIKYSAVIRKSDFKKLKKFQL
jgi:hypothetical protein